MAYNNTNDLLQQLMQTTAFARLKQANAKKKKKEKENLLKSGYKVEYDADAGLYVVKDTTGVTTLKQATASAEIPSTEPQKITDDYIDYKKAAVNKAIRKFPAPQKTPELDGLIDGVWVMTAGNQYIFVYTKGGNTVVLGSTARSRPLVKESPTSPGLGEPPASIELSWQEISGTVGILNIQPQSAASIEIINLFHEESFGIAQTALSDGTDFWGGPARFYEYSGYIKLQGIIASNQAPYWLPFNFPDSPRLNSYEQRIEFRRNGNYGVIPGYSGPYGELSSPLDCQLTIRTYRGTIGDKSQPLGPPKIYTNQEVSLQCSASSSAGGGYVYATFCVSDNGKDKTFFRYKIKQQDLTFTGGKDATGLGWRDSTAYSENLRGNSDIHVVEPNRDLSASITGLFTPDWFTCAENGSDFSAAVAWTKFDTSGPQGAVIGTGKTTPYTPTYPNADVVRGSGVNSPNAPTPVVAGVSLSVYR